MSALSNAHRGWPPPPHLWVMTMRWRELLFAHWPLDADQTEAVKAILPPGLALDFYQGRSYIGVVPFLMERVRPRFVPALPGIDAFPEINLRTYVVAEGKPGVWFFSLDAESRLAVRVARRFFHLPYFDARFRIEITSRISYEAVRTHSGAPPAVFEATYSPSGDPYLSQPGSLEHWLTARYCLYSCSAGGKLFRGDIDHKPWPLQRADAEIRRNTLGDWVGLSLPPKPELLHFAGSLDVRAWRIKPVRQKGPSRAGEDQ